MFGNIGVLVNPAAIQLTKANAYTAAKMVLGLSTPQSQLVTVATNYTNSVIPKISRALSVQQILGDIDFVKFTAAAKDGTDSSVSDKIAKEESKIAGSIGFSDSPLGVPNWIVYGGLGAAAYWYYKKRKKTGTTGASVVPSAAPVVASNPRRRRRNCGCKGR